jgi:acyl-CoA thioester hydrolase
MNKIKISIPEKFDFETQIPVMSGDINSGKHLSNDGVLRLANEARFRFFVKLGFTDSEISDGQGIALLMRNVVIVYKAQGYHGDILNANVAFGEHENSDFELLFQFIRCSDSQEIARVQACMVCYDKKNNNKLVNVPETFINKINKLRREKI